MNHRRPKAVLSRKPALPGRSPRLTALRQQEAELRRVNRALRTLSVCNQALVRAASETALLRDICEAVVREGGYRMAWIGFAEDDPGKTVRPAAHAGTEKGYLALADITWADTERGRGPMGRAIRSGRPFVCRDTEHDPGFAPWRNEALKRGYASALFLPLQAEGRVIGALGIYAAEAGVFDADEVRLLKELAADLAYGIEALRARCAREQSEEALRKSEHSLREAQRVGHMGQWELDLVHNALRWSDEIYRIFELDHKGFGASYEAFLSAIHPDDRERVNQAYTRSVRDRQPYDIVHRLQMKDGRIKHVHERGETFYDQAGRPLRSLGTVQDITVSRQAEEALKQASAYNRSLIEASLDPLVTIGADGKITDVNTATEAATGRARTELIGTDFSDYFTEPEQARAGYQQVFREGAVRDYPLELRHCGGAVTSVLYNASVYRGADGRVAGVFAAARDVTAQKRAEELQARLAAIVDSANDAIVSKGLDGVILTWNPAAERLLGYPVREIVGRHIGLLIPADRKAEEEEILNRIQRGELLQHYESIRLRKDGAGLAVSLTVSPIRDASGRVVAASTIVRDITERKRAEAEIRALNASLEQRVRDRTAELEAANKELETFAYSVSHDLRAPLRSIDGFSRILLEDYGGKLDHEGRDSLVRVRAASQRMGGLIDDLLRLSRATRAEMRRTTVDLTALAGEIMAELQQAEPARRVHWVIAPGLTAAGDPQLLRVALGNLLGNAWKFTSPRPEARIEVGTARVDSGPAFLVRDDGVGFDMAYAGKLFGPFQRLHTTAEFPGTGIGLATVQRIVHRHGGRVWAEGQPNQGATFYFTLPEASPRP